MPGIVKTSVRDPDLQMAQAKIVYERRLRGASFDEIAQELGIQPWTAQRRFALAKRALKVQQAKEDIGDESILSEAMRVLKTALSADNYSAAKDVLTTLGILTKGPKDTAPTVTTKLEMTLDQWRQMKLDTQNAADDAVGLLPAGAETDLDIIDLLPSGEAPPVGDDGLAGDAEIPQAPAFPLIGEDVFAAREGSPDPPVA